jgi:SSS family transporter
MMTWPDYLILFAFLGAVLVLGYIKGRGKTTQDFFVARRQIPWWVACMSFVATEVSAVTLISVPAIAFMENLEYAQFYIGSAAARLVIAFLFIPAFYRYNCVTIYDFLRQRFGAATQQTATIFFFVTRLLGSGVRIMVAALAVSVLMDWRLAPTLALFTVVAIGYVIYGGIKAAVWAGIIQTSVYLLGGLAAIVYILHLVPGGIHGALSVSSAAGRMQIWNWGPALHDSSFLKKFLTDPNIVWIAVLNGFFGSMAAFGTDHELMQRLLTVETRRLSQKTMAATVVASGVLLAVYLILGVSLFAFFQTHPGVPLPQKLDAIFPYFIGRVMPVGLRGLLLGAIGLASLDTPLASLTASFVNDIYRPVIRPGKDDAHYLKVSRVCVGVFAALIAAIAYGFSFYQKFLWLAFKIGGVTFGSMLGVFLLGLLTGRRANRANIIGMTVMAAINAALLILSEMRIMPLGWTWLIIIGTAGTMLIGWVFGPGMENGDA